MQVCRFPGLSEARLQNTERRLHNWQGPEGSKGDARHRRLRALHFRQYTHVLDYQSWDEWDCQYECRDLTDKRYKLLLFCAYLLTSIPKLAHRRDGLQMRWKERRKAEPGAKAGFEFRIAAAAKSLSDWLQPHLINLSTPF
jgi:hypothetical protein